MIGKITKGDDFHGLMSYLTHGGRGQILTFDNLSSETPEEAVGEMEVTAAGSVRTRKPVLHISISYAPGENPSDGECLDDSRCVLDALGLSGHQAVIVRHQDREHHHVHVMANRVGADGRAVSDSRSYARVEAALRRIEARRGLSVTPGRHAPEPRTGARMTGARARLDPRQHFVPESVHMTLRTAQSWPELHEQLAQNGWRLEVVQRRGQKAGAVLIGPGGERVGAGKIDRAATLSKLTARLGLLSQEKATTGSSGRAATSLPSIGTRASGVWAGLAAELVRGIAETAAQGAGRASRQRPRRRRVTRALKAPRMPEIGL